jgi:hypothetical protein
MYTLFNETIWGSSGVTITYPKYEQALKGLRLNLERVVDYNRQYPRATNSNHFLVKLLQSLNVPLSMDVNIYRDRVTEVAEGVGMALNLTSSLYRGRVFSPGVFYGKGSYEIIIAHSEDWDITNIEDEWEDYRPVTFLTHPKTDLGIDLPEGLQNSSETGLSVILVNVPMLACQYKMWRLREWTQNNEAQRTKMQFVASYPLTNALYSQLDLAILNRFQHIYRGESTARSLLRRPFALTDWYPNVDFALDQMSVDFRKRKMSFDQALMWIKGVSNWTLRDAVRIPAMAPTRQVVWALGMARASLVKFLLDWTVETGNDRNKQYANIIQLETSRLLNDSALRGALPPTATKLWEDIFKEIVIKAKSVR